VPIFIISNPTAEMDANMMRSYAAALTTLHHTRHCILIALAVYMVGGLMGWIHADNLTFFHQPAVALADKFEGKHGAGFILALFLHNLVATYITMCTITVWGLVPMVTAMANGLILGWIVVTAVSASLVDAAALLVPHGLFEWPAMMIAWVSVYGVGPGIVSAPSRVPTHNAGENPTSSFFSSYFPCCWRPPSSRGAGIWAIFYPDD